MRTVPLLLPAAALLAGCSMKIDADHAEKGAAGSSGVAAGRDTAVARPDEGQFALSVPGFSAKLAIPGLHFSPKDMDIDGLKLFPGARTTGMSVDARDRPGASDDGVVRIDFTSAAPPAAVLGYYQGEARRAGYAIDPTPAAGSAFSATRQKSDDVTRIAVALRPEGSGSAGTVTVTGG